MQGSYNRYQALGSKKNRDYEDRRDDWSTGKKAQSKNNWKSNREDKWKAALED
jgi:hypothetical protein